MKPRLWVGKMIANNAHHPPLPFTRAISPNKITLAPREGVKRIAFRISREAAYVTCAGYFERFSLRCHVRAGAPRQSQLDRKHGVSGTGWAVRLDLGGDRNTKNKKI